MPPCGYRPDAIAGIEQFLSDNLAFFIDLYRAKGVTPLAAIKNEILEIKSIQNGSRGGVWSATTVGINLVFYEFLLKNNPDGWDAVALIGPELIRQARNDLMSLELKTASAD